VLAEVTRWMTEGISLFAEQWQKIQAERVAPQPTSG